MSVTWTLPALDENIESATVLHVLVKAGDTVQKEDPVIEVETDKVTVEVPCSQSGTVEAVHVKEGETIAAGDPVLTLSGAEETTQESRKTKEEGTHEQRTASKEERATEAAVREDAHAQHPAPGDRQRAGGGHRAAPAVSAAPAVRRLARELGLDLDEIPASGPRGHLLLEDVKEYAFELIGRAKAGWPQPNVQGLPDFSRWGAVARQSMSQIRQKTAERMTVAWQTIPHVTQFDEADITALERARKTKAVDYAASGGKLTVTVILLAVLTRALKAFPKFNASIDMERLELVYKQYFNIGIAVDTDQGLVVPVVHNTDTKDLRSLAKELTELSEKARKRQLTLEHVQGANITITNLGGIGGTNFTPIINPPEVAILAISRTRKDSDRLLLPLGLSYDHRIIDGADAARFLRYVAEALEQFTMA